jgi:hypothetical protein
VAAPVASESINSVTAATDLAVPFKIHA